MDEPRYGGSLGALDKYAADVLALKRQTLQPRILKDAGRNAFGAPPAEFREMICQIVALMVSVVVEPLAGTLMVPKMFWLIRPGKPDAPLNPVDGTLMA